VPAADLASTALNETAVRPETGPDEVVLLKEVADICTGLGRARERDEVIALLARAAAMMDMTGLIVWLGDPGGGVLKPLLAHGYSEQSLARMTAIPHSADNAAAAAYRTGTLQLVSAPSPTTPGAVVVPLLSRLGCVGTLTVEGKAGEEISPRAQLVATLVAAQLTGLLVPPSAAAPEASAEVVSA
jgi:hypothetical protein